MSLTITTRPEAPVNSLLGILMDVVSNVPAPRTVPVANPAAQARGLIAAAAAKTGLISGAAGMVPGPLGVISVIPDMLAVWQVQRQMVADIAGLFGKTPYLGPQTMIACLFKHSAAQAVRDLVVRVGQKWLVRKTTTKALRAVLEKVGVRVLQRAGSRAVARWLPLVGAAAVGAYALYDTRQVGATAVELFGSELALEGNGQDRG